MLRYSWCWIYGRVTSAYLRRVQKLARELYADIHSNKIKKYVRLTVGTFHRSRLFIPLVGGRVTTRDGISFSGNGDNYVFIINGRRYPSHAPPTNSHPGACYMDRMDIKIEMYAYVLSLRIIYRIRKNRMLTVSAVFEFILEKKHTVI